VTKNNLKKNILLLVFTLLLMTAVAEATMRVYFKVTDKIIGVNEKEICDRDMIRRVNNPEHKYYNNLWDSPHYDYSKHAGIIPFKDFVVKKENQFYDKEKGKGTVTTYTRFTNNQRMRGSKDVNITKNPGDLRISVFGDSFTWGSDVYFRHSYAKLF